VHTFDYLVMGIVETEPDVFVVCVTDGYTTHRSYLAPATGQQLNRSY
jgi:hypothetical protein